MKILVCGASGLIGPSVVRQLLAAGHEVVALDINLNPQKLPPQERLSLRRGDVTALADLLSVAKETGAQRLINLAYILPPESESNPRLSLRVNLLGMSNCFETARLLELDRVVYASSVAAYGDQANYGERPVTEDDPCYPLSLYGAAKHFNDLTAARYAENYGLDVVGLRIATVFGYGRETGATAWIGRIPSYAAVGREVRVPLPSGQKSAMIYVDDAAAIFVELCLAPHLNHRVYLSGGDTCSLAELADLVRQIVPDARISFDDSAKDFPHVYIADDSRLREDTGYVRPSLRQRVLDNMNVARAAAGLPPL